MLLCRAWRAFVNQQIAHRHVRITQIGTEQGFAKEIHELIARRVTAEELSTLVAGAVKCAIALLNIINKCAEEGRFQAGFVFRCGGLKLATIEFGTRLADFKHAIDSR